MSTLKIDGLIYIETDSLNRMICKNPGIVDMQLLANVTRIRAGPQ